MSIVYTTPHTFAEEKGPKVVVIGAGLAGLTTAYHLKNKGVDVELFEARNRVGGRIFTVYINGKIGELGAQNITDGGEALHLYRLIDEFGLEVTKNRVNLNHDYFNGKDFIPVNQLLRNKNFNPQILRQQLDRLVSNSHNMKDVLSGIVDVNDPLHKVMAVRLAAYEGGPIEKLSPFYAETLFHMLLGGICSVHQGNGEEENYVDLVSVKGGNGLIAEKIAENLGSRLHLNKALTKVAKNSAGNFVLSFNDGSQIKADILVLAIPCSVYETIIFDEDIIPSDRLKAIQSINYGTNAKILVPLSISSSKRTGIVNDKIVSFFDSIQNILTVYYTGEISTFSGETILNTFLKARPMLEKGFEESCSSFINPKYAEDQAFASYDRPVGYSWPNDPYVRGSYSYISSGQETLLTTLSEEKGEKFKSLFSPIDNLYFAGEHTSILLDIPGTMEAACESGERVARTILKLDKLKD